MGRVVLRLIIGPVVATGLTVASLAVGPLSAVADDGTTDPTVQTSPPSDTGTGAGPSAGDTTGTDSGTGSTGSTGSTGTSADPSGTTDGGTSPSAGETGTTSPGAGGAATTAPSAGETGTTPPPAPVVDLAKPTLSQVKAVNQVTRSITLGFTSTIPGVTFQCSLAGPSHEFALRDCAGNQITISGMTPGSYTFSVKAVDASDPAQVHESPLVSSRWTILAVWAPSHYGVPAGATFNNPYGSTAAKRRNLSHVINTINSMPGYRVGSQRACPTDPAQYPSTIRISLYSATDMAFARALVNASRRCVSTQILMNNHLGPKQTPSIRYMQKYLGAYPFYGRVPNRNFAHRCNYGCRGGGVLHSKFYLFDSPLVAPGGVAIRGTVMVGSSNMTSNASGVQWNDLYTVKNDATLLNQFSSVYNVMKLDRDQRKTLSFTDGIYSTVFTPLTPHTADPAMTALRSIHCVGATTGNAGHTVVYINMHAWFELRGYALAHQVRSMSNHGCQVNILYSFMSKTVYNILRGAPRMSLRRTIFAKADGIHAKHYTHFKMIAADGYVGSNRGAKVVWTGSNNFTNDGTHFDEVTMRIASAAAFAQYRAQFVYMRNTHSSPIYVKLLEPVGGGRAIDQHV